MVASLAAAARADFRRQRRQRNVALRYGAETVTYAELHRDVAAMRETLARIGLRPGARVALALPKSIAAVELILAVLATGAAYVPVNPRQPAVRLRATLRDVDPALVVAPPELARVLHADWDLGRGCPIATIGRRGIDLSDITLRRHAGPETEGAACILYTSGSTGEPKGIALGDANIASFVDWAAGAFDIGPRDRLANVAPLHFDLSLFDLFCGLSRHASVHLLPEDEAAFPGGVRAWIDAEAISVWYSVPTLLAQLQQRRALKDARSLRLVLFAGEVFPVPVLRRLMVDLPQPDYVNCYGPTESNVCTYYRLPGPPESDGAVVPIGLPCEHLRVTVRDDEMGELRSGEIGEICVAGPAVMRGYWRREAITDTTRVSGQADSYRTGDFGWRQDDGTIIFAGRRDQQVKLRGHRVELLALEAVLNAHPAIHEAAALTLPDDGGGDRLAVFMVPARGTVPEVELRRFVADHLPAAYQPDQFHWLSAMPRTANGKCDRVALRSLG